MRVRYIALKIALVGTVFKKSLKGKLWCYYRTFSGALEKNLCIKKNLCNKKTGFLKGREKQVWKVNRRDLKESPHHGERAQSELLPKDKRNLL